MIAHCPALTAMTEPFEMMLSSAVVFELRPCELVRFRPLMMMVSGVISSQ